MCNVRGGDPMGIGSGGCERESSREDESRSLEGSGGGGKSCSGIRGG